VSLQHGTSAASGVSQAGTGEDSGPPVFIAFIFWQTDVLSMYLFATPGSEKSQSGKRRSTHPLLSLVALSLAGFVSSTSLSAMEENEMVDIANTQAKLLIVLMVFSTDLFKIITTHLL
jgi:hypothetical protein